MPPTWQPPEARGDLILWTDDDVLVDPAWLASYVRTAEANPQAAFFGGAILRGSRQNLRAGLCTT